MTQLWQDHPLAAGQALRWRVENLHLYVCNEGHEWLVQRWWDPPGPAPENTPMVLAESVTWEPANSSAEVERISVDGDHEVLRIAPLSADLDVVSHPIAPMLIAPDSTARLYVSAPLWMQLSLPNSSDAASAGVALGTPFPIEWMKRTWFGRNTTRGEICYAGRTRCLTDLDVVRVDRRPWRAVTPISIRNRASDPWRLDKVRLPVTALALYAASSADTSLWTPEIRTRRADNGETGELTTGDGPPAEAPGATRLAAPRVAQGSLLGRVYGNLFEGT